MINAEIVLEMGDRPWGSNNSATTDFVTSSIYLNPANYDHATYYWEVMVCNTHLTNNYDVKLLSAGSLKVTITVPANTPASGGGTNFERLRSVSFVPDTGNQVLMYRSPVTASNNNVIVQSARIIIVQVNGTITRVQVPLMLTEVNSNLDSGGSSAHIQFGSTTYGQQISSNFSLFKLERALLATIASGNPWSWETIGYSTGGGTTKIGLFDFTANLPIGTVENSHSAVSIQSVDFADVLLTDLHNHEARVKSTTGAVSASAWTARLYVKLTACTNTVIYRRVTYKQLQLIDTSLYSDAHYYHEGTGYESTSGTITSDLWEQTSSDDTTTTPTLVASTSLTFAPSTKSRQRSVDLALTSGHRFIRGLTVSSGVLELAHNFVIITVGPAPPTTPPPEGHHAYIEVQNGAGELLDYSYYYDRTQAPFEYSETYDHRRGRTKTGRLTLFRVNSSFIEPQPDWIVKVYRDWEATDLMFGGIIVGISERVITKAASAFYVRAYDLDVAGYDPTTLQYREVTSFDRINITSGQLISDLITKYAPWIGVGFINTATSPVIKHINIIRRRLDEVINNILEKTGWTFYVDDLAYAYFDDPDVLSLDWDLDEGSLGDTYPGFDIVSLEVQTNTQENYNDITLIGSNIKGRRMIEIFNFRGFDAKKPLQEIPYGLDKVIIFFDAHDAEEVDAEKWIENDTADRVTESLGRLQISSSITTIATLTTIAVFDRSQNVEYRVSELEITSYGGNVTLGFFSGSHFVHAFCFDFLYAKLQILEGATYTLLSAFPDIGEGIYSLRIKIHTLGASYFVQGGRTATPKEFGELGSKTWTKVFDSSVDYTAFFQVRCLFDSGIGATMIRQKVSTDIDISAVLKETGYIGTGPVLTEDLDLVVGVQGADDFETDCFIGLDGKSAFLSFYTDNIPVGGVVLSYWATDVNFRERVFSRAGKEAVDARSALVGDDGTRDLTIQNKNFIFSPQDARDLLVAILNDGVDHHYTGTFVTNTDRIYSMTVPGHKPYAGQKLTVNLPTTTGKSSFSEIITNVSAKDIGAEIYEFQITFGEGQFDLERLFLKITRKTGDLEIIDDQEAAVDVDAEEITTAMDDRPATPEMVSALFDGTGLSLEWTDTSVTYELRDNLFQGQGQGGSLIYQNSSATTFTITPTNIKTVHKKRRFKFFVWAIDADSRYSKYPLEVTMENPQPEPLPLRDILNTMVPGDPGATIPYFPRIPNIGIRFNPIPDWDILVTGGVRVQIATDADFTSLFLDDDYDRSLLMDGLLVEAGLAADTLYYIRYGLRDDYTDDLDDMIWSGIREVQTMGGTVDGSTISGTLIYRNGVEIGTLFAGASQTRALYFTIGDGVNVIPTGVCADLPIPVSCTITGIELLADASGSIVLDIWKDTYANYPPTVADTITASAKPTLSSSTKAVDTTLTGWSKTITAGDTIRVNVDSASTVKRVVLMITVTT